MTIFGYVRTSRHLQDGVAGMDPFSQELRFREAGVQRDNVYLDIGVSGATGTDQRHGWHRLDTLQCIIALRARGVKIRSLDETEGWTRFLELAPDDPLAFVGHQMVSMAAWVADQEREWDAGAPGRAWRRQEPGARPWDVGGPSPTTRCNWPGA